MIGRAFLDTFFSENCAGCGAVLGHREQVLCTSCLHRLPLISKQLYAEYLITQALYGRVPIAHAASLMFYHKKGISQHILHQLKYRGDERVSGFLGKWLGSYLQSKTWATSIDVVIPVPLHKKRLRKRGYNQVTGFGKALAKRLQAVYREDILIKTFNSRTQVFKNRWARTELKTAFFALQNPSYLWQKHVLLVDDIITTGTTLETCSNCLLRGIPSKISIATMAITV